ncbi:hypothetical protein HZC30_04330 [Candidatus Woesearchaeota archaeon]|nr:hypothetical protein [Candidatus Woesearchaeota archaeon]
MIIKDGKLEFLTLRLRTYLTTTEGLSFVSGGNVERPQRKGLLVEYDTTLEDMLTARGVKNAKEIARLFASGAEKVDVDVDSLSSRYQKTEDRAYVGEDDFHNRASIRDLAYRCMWTTDGDSLYGPAPPREQRNIERTLWAKIKGCFWR